MFLTIISGISGGYGLVYYRLFLLYFAVRHFARISHFKLPADPSLESLLFLFKYFLD